ncbi:hypothetical protein [Ruegeria hyattellae]|uniref:hypothetical protein n=1 Tax=Ruegeria hyattellae TaxID=3233337 RepID=UPI00355BF407
MWVKHKANESDTLQSVTKQYKIKDPNAVLKHPQNRKVLPLLKKGSALKKGTVVWVPDPKAKVYVVNGPKGQMVLNEKDYRTYLTNVHKTMDRALTAIRLKYDYAIGRHDTQRKINDDQWFVSSVVETFSSASEPKRTRKLATNAIKQLAQTTKGRKYGVFAKHVEAADKEITAYTNDVHKWVGGLIGTAESTVAGLKVVKEAGIFCGTVVAVTITAPASLPAAALVGGLSSAGVNLAFDGADALGRWDSGLKQRSAGEIATRTMTNALAGAAGSAIAGGIAKYAAKPLLSALASRPMISAQVVRLSQSRVVSRVLEKEAAILAKELAKKDLAAFSLGIKNFPDKVVSQALMKFFIRFGTGGLSKLLSSSGEVELEVSKWMAKNPKKLGQKSGQVVGAAAAADLAKGKISDILYERLLTTKKADFTKILRVEMEAYAKSQSVRA